MTCGLSNPYHLDKSIFIIGGHKEYYFNFYIIFDEIHVSKQVSPRWDAEFCGFTTGAIRFAHVP